MLCVFQNGRKQITGRENSQIFFTYLNLHRIKIKNTHTMETLRLIFYLLIGGLILPLLIYAFVGKYQASRCGANIGLKEVFLMQLRKTNDKKLFEAIGRVQKAGLDIEINRLEGHHLAGGDLKKVITFLLEHPEHPKVNFEALSALDLAGIDFERLLA